MNDSEYSVKKALDYLIDLRLSENKSGAKLKEGGPVLWSNKRSEFGDGGP